MEMEWKHKWAMQKVTTIIKILKYKYWIEVDMYYDNKTNEYKVCLQMYATEREDWNEEVIVKYTLHELMILDEEKEVNRIKSELKKVENEYYFA